MKHEAFTARILAACFEVSNEPGCGFLDSVYQNALTIALQNKGLTVGLLVNYGAPKLEYRRFDNRELDRVGPEKDSS